MKHSMQYTQLARCSQWLLATAMVLLAPLSMAVECTVSAQGVSFGSYDRFSVDPLDSTGNIAVSCDGSTSYSIALSAGAGAYASRSMVSGVHTLAYNLYTDFSRTSIWGDGTAGTTVVSGNGTTGNHTVFGRIPASQNAHVGTYSDTITVTLTF